MAVELVCPACHGILFLSSSTAKCTACLGEYRMEGGSIDFVGSSSDKGDERDFYERRYSENKDMLSQKVIEYETEGVWRDRLFPSGQDILNALSCVKGKTILCLGNGLSLKEFYFAKQGADLCISDLSFSAINNSKKIASSAFSSNKIKFHAIDALQLPFMDSSLDIVYGYAFVHHLPDKVLFLQEVSRVLKNDGVCVFYDDGYSCIWHSLKMSLLKGLMNYSHRKTGISPEDHKASISGGFTEEEIRDWGMAARFSSVYIFKKREFLTYFWLRGMEKIFRLDKKILLVRLVGTFLSIVDGAFAVLRFYRENMIRLVWGFRK